MTRIGTAYNILLAKNNLASNRAAYSKALEPLSTGSSINRPSDDPARLTSLFQNNSELTRIDQYELNITTARTRIQITDSTLSSVNDLVGGVYEIALQGNNQTMTTEEISFLTDRLADLKEDIQSLSNTKLGNYYVFSGFKTTTEPFSGTPVVYNGDSNLTTVKVSSTKEVQVGLNGDDVFLGGGTGVDIFDTIDELVTAITAQDETSMANLITDIQTFQDQISSARGTLGNSEKALGNAETLLQNLEVQISERIAAVSDVDIAKATTDLSFKEYTLKSSLEVTRRVLEVQLKSILS